MQDHNVKQLGRISMYAKCIGGCMQGAIVRVRIPGYVLKKKEFFKEFYNIPMLFLSRSSRQKSIA